MLWGVKIAAGSSSTARLEGVGEAAGSCEGTQCAEASADDNALHASIGASAGKSESSQTPIDTWESDSDENGGGGGARNIIWGTCPTKTQESHD